VRDKPWVRRLWSQPHLLHQSLYQVAALAVVLIFLCTMCCTTAFARVESDLFVIDRQSEQDIIDIDHPADAQTTCQAWRDANAVARHAESLLIQSALGDVQRQGDTLLLDWQKHRYTLDDQCDDASLEQRVAYQLQDIRHLQLSWVVSEQTAQRTRYLLIDPLHDNQLVLPAFPVFSPDQQRFIMIHETIQNDTVVQRMHIYQYQDQHWVRQYEQSRIQLCETCQNKLWQPPQIEWLTDQQIQVELNPIRVDEVFRPVVRRLRLYQQPNGQWQRSDER
jgi:hypothetical protein